MSETITLTDAEISTLEGTPRSGPTPVHSHHMDDTDTLIFKDCKKGLGVKIIGGRSEDGGMDYGIFVKRVLNGGLAAKGGQLFEGDQILSVNGESLLRVTNERAVQILRSASATNRVTLVITRNPSAKKDFSMLCESQMQYSRSASSSSLSDTRSVSSLGSSANYASGSPRSIASSSSMTSSRITAQRMENVQQITIPKIAGLGLSIGGGVDQSDGPIIYIDHIIVGGDCHKDGRLRVGDQLVAMDGQTLIGLKQDEVKALMTRIKLRTEKPSTTVHFIRSSLQNTSSQSPMPSTQPTNPSSNYTPSSHLDTPHSYNQSNHSSPHSRLGYNSSPNYLHPSELVAQMQASQVNHMTPSPHLASVQRSPSQTNPAPRINSPHLQKQVRNSPIQQVSSPSTNMQSYQLGSANGPIHYANGDVPHQTPLSALPSHIQGLHAQPKMSSTPQADHANTTSPGASLQLPQITSTGDPSPVMQHGPPHLGMTTLSSQQNSQSTSGLGSSSSRMSRNRRLSLDPQVRLRIDKLEVALQYLGLQPDEALKMELRRRLTIDENGMVPYGDFVRTAREVLRFQLDDHGISATSLMFAAHDVTDFAEPPPFIPQVPQVLSPVYENTEQLKQERDEALLEVERLKGLLNEKESTCNIAEEELLRIRREAQGAIHESRALKSRVHLAEAAQKEARNMEIDYEEVVGLLEKEIADLRRELKQNKASPTPATQDASSGNLQRKLAILSCELRKCQVGKKVYEVSTNKLLKFSELVHETLMDQHNGPGARSRGEAARRGENGYYPPGYLAQHGRNGPINLAAEARDTVKAVKSLMESEPLPYGWEEAYTADGMKYYLNHQNQMSTWSHPVSNIAQLQQPRLEEVDDLQESRT
ncbi:syntaxin-binding protein 4-like isoform X2 [Anneissia japonica]|uniref:syntaxin-binding protein 4-like isoform X2 n=1 Tax=Anneissia japonica TaxID=1529436 RepID=UPI0014254BDD|nr:syntaxin-binding protein 4-like isoform X2 [Anneissia japonica]